MDSLLRNAYSSLQFMFLCSLSRCVMTKCNVKVYGCFLFWNRRISFYVMSIRERLRHKGTVDHRTQETRDAMQCSVWVCIHKSSLNLSIILSIMLCVIIFLRNFLLLLLLLLSPLLSVSVCIFFIRKSDLTTIQLIQPSFIQLLHSLFCQQK